ncbi:hypothetical protein [Candidatus Caldatribacterium sp.]|uniref:SU10 major capsid protein n=1 Tax=Candidatus Caldatribacterium sp. TaxID=2282143 RepID=UPI003840B456|nr:DUF5309 domain-containing protein [Candidatus Caldatribacterium sp.]
MLLNGIHTLGDGFDFADQQIISEIRKATEIGYEINPFNLTSGVAPLRAEVVEQTLKVITYTEEHFRFFREVPKGKALSNVVQYIKLYGYGRSENLFLPAGENPPYEDNADFARGIAHVKYLGTLRIVNHVATLVQTHIMNVIAAENMAGARHLARQLELALFWGNSKLGPGGGEWYEFDGLYNQVEEVFDLAGEPLTEATINDIVQVVLDNYGFPNRLYVSPAIYSDLIKQIMGMQRVLLPTKEGGYAIGAPIDVIRTQGGPIGVVPVFFLGKGDFRNPLRLAPTAASHVNAATAPASVTVSINPTPNGAEWHKLRVDSATIKYRVTAVNRFGESAPVESSAVVLTSADFGKSINLTITNSSTLANPPAYFNIYRSDNGGKFYWVKAIPTASESAGGITTWSDKNGQMPGYHTAFLGEFNSNVLEFLELMPLTQVPLAQIQPAIRWLLLMYATFVVYAPRKIVTIRNIGRIDNSQLE